MQNHFPNIYYECKYSKIKYNLYITHFYFIILLLNNNLFDYQMVKAYFKYQFSQVVGQVCSTQANFKYHEKKKILYCPVNQYIAIIHAKLGEVVKYLYKENKNINIRYVELTEKWIAAGYEDGEIIVWDIQTYQQLYSFNKHKSTVSCIKISEYDMIMVSAGFDANIIIWDLLSEECVTINNAHKGSITQIEIIKIYNQVTCVYEDLILSSAKDGFFKIWNMKNRLLLQVVSSLSNEIWSFCYNQQSHLVYIGTNKQELPIIKIGVTRDEETKLNRYCEIVAKFKRNTFARPLQMILQRGTLYILNSDKILEIYKILGQDQLKKRKKRIVSRKKGKQTKMEIQSESQQVQPNQLIIDRNDEEIRIKLQKTKPLLQKAFNMVIIKNKILINNGTNIYDLNNEITLTNSLGITHNLTLSHPYISHQSNQQLKIFQNNGVFLYTVPLEVVHSVIYKGYLLILAEKSIIVWDLSKNEQILRKQAEWNKIYASDFGVLTWKQGLLGFYSFGYTKKKILQLNKQTQKFFNENITQASFLNNQKYIVCTQDSNVHIIHSDSHKEFLKLYGHKLPILSYDTSSDQTLLVTGSVDKDIKLWGLDFGNCVKSIFAHSEAVTIVKFVKDTHYFFSGSKDGHIKYWDGDKYQLILDLEQCISDVRNISISNSGDYFIAGGNDRGFRIWKQTTEQVFYSEQQQKRVQKMMIQDYATKKFEQKQQKTTYMDLKHGQQIIECLQAQEQPQELLKLLKKISPSKLKSSLSFLHSHHIRKLVIYLKYYLKNKVEYELIWRIFQSINLDQNLGEQLRQEWTKNQQILEINIEAIRLIKKSIEENKAFNEF